MDFFELPAINQTTIDKQNCFLLFETSLCDNVNHLSYIFSDPIEIIKVYDFNQVRLAFEKIQKLSSRYYIAGYLAYELGYYFQGIEALSKYDFPLINMAVFKKPLVFNHKKPLKSGFKEKVFRRTKTKDKFSVNGLNFIFNRDTYAKKILYLKEQIKNGNTYQVNFTGRYDFDFKGSAYSFYNELKARQNVAYSAFCKFDGKHVISLSPELFFRKKKQVIISKPMKGTICRGKDTEEDNKLISELKNSQKNLSENLMIVDLIRNDLGRICQTSSVKVDKLFEIEKFESLFQMTSTVKGVLKKNLSYFEIFKNLFPGGSVTGAPKISTMKIIKDVESIPRNVYCGALGFITPDNEAIFNLPIRTVVLENGLGQMGVGSGIVADSDIDNEFQECELKADFLIKTER